MRTVGINGGHSTYGLGESSRVVLFFDCLNFLVKRAYPALELGLISDRLYKRYLRNEELTRAGELMDIARSVFVSTPVSSIDWGGRARLDQISLNINGNLDDIFSDIFFSFIKAKGSAISFLGEFGVYQPVRIIPYDLPFSMIEKNRPLIEYDALGKDDCPFWLR